MGLFKKKKTIEDICYPQYSEYDEIFVPITELETTIAKRFVIACYDLSDKFTERLNLREIDFKKRAAIIAFFKVQHYRFLTDSHVVHNLFYTFAHDMEKVLSKSSDEDVALRLHMIHGQEFFFMKVLRDNEPEKIAAMLNEELLSVLELGRDKLSDIGHFLEMMLINMLESFAR